MNILRWVILTIVFVSLTVTAPAQDKVVRMVGSGGTVKTFKGELFDIPELGAIIAKSDSGNLKVEHVVPPEARPKAYADVDLKPGDEILVVNGKRVKTIKEIEQQYKSIPVGGEVKLGIQRGNEMMISRFAKADPKDLPQRKMMIVTSDGPAGDIRPLPNLGIILGKGKEEVVIKEMLDNAAKAFTDAGVKPGDRLVSINGHGIKNLDEFSKEFLAVSPGTTMTWIVAHNGGNLSLTLTRPEPQGQVIIKQETK
jgi:C-terminal processing protease CtpA/Prc